MTLIQREVQKVYMWKEPYTDYSAMQGPCPSGFHIPTDTEWQSIIDAGVSLGAWTTSTPNSMVQYLKLPNAGCRNTDGDAIWGGSYGCYWSCSYDTNGYAYSMTLGVSGGSIKVGITIVKNGYCIRAIKDTSVVPDSSRTVLYQGTGDAGIFHNSTLGIISLSSDGTNWVTIADKNVGATSTDTSSSNSYGNYYQWGNIYGFPNSGSITTSTTRVNASTYGPGNYYNSSTFINNSSYNSWDTSNNSDLRGGTTGTTTGGGDIQVRPTEYDGPELCFTANTAGSTVQLTKTGNPTAVTLETSTDGETWSAYTIGDTITLANIGDKVYWRNTSTTTTLFSIYATNYYQYVMTGSIDASGDVTSLVNKNCTDTLSGNFCFAYLFFGCTSLRTTPRLPATTLTNYCYSYMFNYCANLETLPSLPALTTAPYCYQYMFAGGCSKIKLSTTQTGEYQTAYRIPTTGTGTAANRRAISMFNATGGTFTGDPSINTTYYTSNTVI